MSLTWAISRVMGTGTAFREEAVETKEELDEIQNPNICYLARYSASDFERAGM
jgi:hypothetical protein